jgi:cytochrome c1
MERAAPTIIAAVAALALAVAPAGALAKPAGGGTSKSEHCAPGAREVDETGKTVAVCNKNNQWVKVIRMTAPGGSTQTTLGTAQGPIVGAGS